MLGWVPIEIDDNSFAFVLKESDIEQSSCTPASKQLGEQHAEQLPEIRADSCADSFTIANEANLVGEETDVSGLTPARKILRNHCAPEVLPSPPVDTSRTCSSLCYPARLRREFGTAHLAGAMCS